MANITGTYQVNFNANGGSGGPGSQSGSYSAASGSNYSFTLASGRPSRSGYYFRGWATSAGGAAAYQPGGTYTFPVRANMPDPYTITLYAVWSRQSTLIFDGQGATSGVPASISRYQNSTANLPTTIPARAGYTFKGWNTKADGTGTMYQPGGTVKWATGGNWYLYAIWEGNPSTLSASDGTIGSAMTLSISRSNASFTHTIKYAFGRASGTIATKTENTSVSWTPPKSLAQQIPNATKGTVTFTIETYDGSTLIGSTTKSVSLSISSSMVPTISTVTLAEAVSGLANQFGAYVQGKSKINVKTTAAGVQDSTIEKVEVTINGQTLSGANVTTGFLGKAGTNRCTVKVTDSRGQAETKTISFAVTAHTAPTVKIAAAARGSDLTTGVINYSWDVAPVGDRNTKTIKILYKQKTETTWTTAATITPTAYSGAAAYTIPNLSEGYDYDVRVQASDYFASNVHFDTVIPPSDSWEIDVHPGDGTIAMHGEAPGDGKDHWYKNDVVFHESIEVRNVFDVVKRRCYATLSSEGWYRVCKFDFYSYGEAIGASGGVLHIDITDAYGSSSNDSHKIDLLFAHNKITFLNESSVGNFLNVDKIRYTFNGNSPYEGFVDIHWASSNSSYVGVSFDYTAISTARQANLTSQNLVAVADSPSGETVLTTYEFTADGVRLGSISANSGYTFNEVRVAQSGRVCEIQFYVTGAFTAHTYAEIGAFSGIQRPIANKRLLCGCGAYAYEAYNPCYAIAGSTGVLAVSPSVNCSAIVFNATYIV